jgi:hypothetical protein
MYVLTGQYFNALSINITWSRNTSAGIATGYGLDGWFSIPGSGKSFFIFSTTST